MSEPAVAESLREYGRGMAGGLLFSLPLLYTMEVWWAGFIADSARLLLMLGFTFILLLGYNRFAGLRRDASWAEIVIDSVEELGLGLVTAAAVLFFLGRIGPGTPLDEIIGKTTVEGAVVAIGFSVGTAQLGLGGRQETGTQQADRPSFLSHIVIAFCGAVLFAANVAPTEEILMIAVETEPVRLLGLAVLSVLVGMVILFHLKFARSERMIDVASRFDVVLGSTVTYAIALVASAIILWFFGRFEGHALEVCVSETVVLGFPAALGASAGRLLLSS